MIKWYICWYHIHQHCKLTKFRQDFIGPLVIDTTLNEKALKNTLLNKSAIESPDNKFADGTLKDGSKGLMYSPCTLMDYASIYGKA